MRLLKPVNNQKPKARTTLEGQLFSWNWSWIDFIGEIVGEPNAFGQYEYRTHHDRVYDDGETNNTHPLFLVGPADLDSGELSIFCKTAGHKAFDVYILPLDYREKLNWPPYNPPQK